jgi:hypothetical protein
VAWIELHQAVWTHRKTFELAGILNLDETYAAAHVIRLWTWALDNAPDGVLSTCSARAIAYGAGWRGSDAETFVEALVHVGWLDENLTIHDWDKYAGRLIDRRAANAERMRSVRATRVRAVDETRATHVQRTVRERAGLPYRTVPDNTVPESNPLSVVSPPAENGTVVPTTTKAGSKAGKSKAPDSLEPNEADLKAGAEVGLSREQVAAKSAAMLDHFRAKGELRADWHATLRTWLRNTPKFDAPVRPDRNGIAPMPTGAASKQMSSWLDYEGGRYGVHSRPPITEAQP